MTEGWPVYSGDGWRVYEDMVDDFLQIDGPRDESMYTPMLYKETRSLWVMNVVRRSDHKPVYSMWFSLVGDENDSEYSRVEAGVEQCIHAHREERNRLAEK